MGITSDPNDSNDLREGDSTDYEIVLQRRHHDTMYVDGSIRPDTVHTVPTNSGGLFGLRSGPCSLEEHADEARKRLEQLRNWESILIK